MTIPKPNLEDRTFDQLVEEARTLIPRYAPAWTDHNWSDPGITLIDLQAWITEAELYRVNLVTDRHRGKYLRLLGRPPAGPSCARVDLTFTPVVSRVIAKGTTVTAILPEGNIAFEVDEDLPLAPIRLQRVLVDEGSGALTDRSAENNASDQFYAPFGLRMRAGAALYLGFDTASESLSFRCYLYENDLIPPGSHGGEPPFDLQDLRVRWEYRSTDNWGEIRPTPGGGTAPVVSDDTGSFRKSGRLVFQDLDTGTSGVGPWVATTLPNWQDADGTSRLYYWLRCVLEESTAAFPPRIEAIRLNTVTATEGSTHSFPETQKGDGLPRQAMRLKRSPVIPESLELFVRAERWDVRDDLDSSGPDDLHATVTRETDEVLFGDGFHGKVPPAGSLIRVERYRTGGGAAGNVRPGTPWNDDGMSMAEIINDLPAAGGADAETIEEAVQRFLDDLHTPYPAVTSPDFEYLAVNTPGVRVWKAKAVPGYHPEKPLTHTDATVTVAVIPFTPLLHLDDPPLASREFLGAVARHLDRHRLLCTRCCVVPAIFVRVDVEISVVPEAGNAGGPLDRFVMEALEGFLHPIHGWTDGGGWPMGQHVYRSELYRVVEAIDGVRCSGRLVLTGNQGARRDGAGNLILPSPIATVYAGSITVRTIADQRECRRREDHGTG